MKYGACIIANCHFFLEHVIHDTVEIRFFAIELERISVQKIWCPRGAKMSTPNHAHLIFLSLRVTTKEA